MDSEPRKRKTQSRSKGAKPKFDAQFAARLREAIGGRSLNGVARGAGISQPLLSAYLTKTRPGVDKVALLAGELGVRLEWLATGAGAKFAPGTLRVGFGASELVMIPVFDTIEPCRRTALYWSPDGEPVARVELPLQAVQDRLKCAPEALIAVPVVGRSMEPMYRDGELALIDRSRTEVPAEGGHYLLRLADRICIRHIKIDGRHLVLSSIDAADFPAERLGMADALRLQVLGRIAGTQSDPRRARLEPPG